MDPQLARCTTKAGAARAVVARNTQGTSGGLSCDCWLRSLLPRRRVPRRGIRLGREEGAFRYNAAKRKSVIIARCKIEHAEIYSPPHIFYPSNRGAGPKRVLQNFLLPDQTIYVHLKKRRRSFRTGKTPRKHGNLDDATVGILMDVLPGVNPRYCSGCLASKRSYQFNLHF